MIASSSASMWRHRGVGRTGVAVAFAMGIVVALGIALRAIQYAADRSLWFDEAMLALNILDRSAAGLTRTLDYSQAAPLGFLELEKLATHALGSSELSLRLLPLLCGLASVPLFAAVALRILRPTQAVLATLLFACASGPVYYASELKQYSGDLAVTVLLVLLATWLLDESASRLRLAVVAVVGAVAMALSHAAVFVAGGIALALFVRSLLRRDRSALASAVAVVPWLLTGLAVVLFTNARTARLDAAIGSGGSLYPKGSAPTAQVDWGREVMSALLRGSGFPDAAPDRYAHWPLVALGLAGLVGMVRRNATVAAMLALPLPVMWVASELHKYPILDRTVLYLVPASLLFVAEGVGVAVSVVRGRPRLAASVCLACGVLLVPVVHAATHVVHPVQHEEIGAALDHIRRDWRRGDGLFVDDGARFALRYYLDCGCLAAARVQGSGLAWRFGEGPGGPASEPVPLRRVDPRFVVGQLDVGSPGALTAQLDGLSGRSRVWILYTHVDSPAQSDRIALSLHELERRGRLLDSFAATGAHAYLLDLRLRSP